MGTIRIRVVETGGTWDYLKQVDNLEVISGLSAEDAKKQLHRNSGTFSGHT